MNKATKDEFTRIIVQVSELPKIDSPSIDVYCTKEQAQSQIDKGQLNAGRGVHSAYEVAGPALFYILAVPQLNMKTNEFKPLPSLQPIIHKLVTVGSPSS